MPQRVVRSRKGIEIVLNCKVKPETGHLIRSSNRTRPEETVPIERYHVSRMYRSFELIQGLISAEIGIEDITRPGLWFEYAPLRYIYVGVHGLFRKVADYKARCRLKVGR